MLNFTWGYTDEMKMKHWLRAISCTWEEIAQLAETTIMKWFEDGQTSRVVFGGVDMTKDLDDNGWKIYNPIDFLSTTYFDKFNKDL